MTHDDHRSRPVPPPRPSLEREPQRGRADPIPKPPAEGSGARARELAGLTLQERQDLAEAATRRAVDELVALARDEANQRVLEEADRLELVELRRKAAATQTSLKRRGEEVEARTRALKAALASLALALVAWATREITGNEVETKAVHAAEVAVEERAAPIEERADAAAVTATANDARQTAAEAKALAVEAERSAQIERLIRALEADVAARSKRGAR